MIFKIGNPGVTRKWWQTRQESTEIDKCTIKSTDDCVLTSPEQYTCSWYMQYNRPGVRLTKMGWKIKAQTGSYWALSEMCFAFNKMMKIVPWINNGESKPLSVPTGPMQSARKSMRVCASSDNRCSSEVATLFLRKTSKVHFNPTT